MNFDLNIYSLALLTSSLVVSILSVVIFKRLGDTVRWFTLTMIAISFWGVTYGLELSVGTLEEMLFWIKLEYIAISYAPVFWIIFCLKFTNQFERVSRVTIGSLFLISTLTLIIVWTNSYHQLHYKSVSVDNSGPFPLLDLVPGIWYAVHTIFFYVTLLWGNYLLISRFIKADSVYRKQINIIVFSSFIPWIGNVIYLLGYRPFGHIDLTPYTFLATYMIVGLGMLKFRLFDVIPVAKEKLINAMQEGLIIINAKDDIIEVNQAANQYFNLPTIQPVGKRFQEVFPNLQKLHEIIKDRYETELKVTININDEPVEFLVKTTSLFERKTIFSGMLILFRDITEETKQSKLLQEQKNELETLNQLKDKLFSIIAHDLRGPLSGIKDILSLTKSGDISEKEFLNLIPDITTNIDATAILLDNLLTWSKSQLEGEKLNVHNISLHGLVEKEFRLLQSKAQEKEIKLINHIPNKLMASADEDMVDIIIRNLLSNAIKFSKRGEHITVSASEENDKIRITVEDNGTGISMENIEKLNANNTFSTIGTAQEKGTGLGLMLVREFVHKNGGELTIESQVGSGSKFSFTLPIYDEKLIHSNILRKVI